MNTLFISSILLVLMYLISGYDKIMDMKGNAISLKNKTGLNLPFTLFLLAILIVILLEIVGSTIILYSSYTGKNKKLAYYSTNGLIAFTILASLIYHMPVELNNHALFKNIAITGGLILLADRFNN
jgi:uncharacterized membrane protein YphA (DoxX/SURF4 family)